MSNTIVIESLEQLNDFLNEKGVMEIAIRERNSRFKRFQKVAVSNLQATQEKELTQKVVHAPSNYTLLSKRNLNLLANVAKLGKIGILLNGMNLCATCSGFAMIYPKLDAMSTEINQQLQELQKTMKQTQDIQNDYEFNKVLSKHMDMLDCQRKQHPYTEEKMRELVDSEYNILILLVRSFQKDISGNQGVLISSIFSILAMFTVSLRNFDELYYFNNCQTLGKKGVWHLAHDKWMSVFDIMSSKWFVEKLQDYGTFEIKLSTFEVDSYYINLLDQVADLRIEVEDNQELVVAIGDVELYRQYKEISAQEVMDTIEAAYREAGSDLDEETVRAAYQSAVKQAAMV